MVGHLPQLGEIVSRDDVLAERWLPAWETATARRFADALAETTDELQHQTAEAISAARRLLDGESGLRLYGELVKSLGGLKAQTRGAGTITAVLSLWLAWAFSADPVAGLRVSAGLINSDTDTVSTMAGALLGAVATEDPPGELLDRDLIACEANRLEMLAQGKETAPSFPHPDPLHWQPPPSLSDALGLIDNRPAIAGLGLANLLGEPIRGEGKQGGLWQWVMTDYGQSLLIKRREELPNLPQWAQPRLRPRAASNNGAAVAPTDSTSERSGLPADPEQGAKLFFSHLDDDRLLGLLLRHYADQGPLPAAVFATLISSELSKR